MFSPQKDLWSPNLFKTRQVYRCAGVKLVVRLLPHHWWCPSWCAAHTQNPALCEKIQFSFAPQRSDWIMSFGRRKSLQGTTRGQAFLFCQGPVSSAFPSNLDPFGGWRKDPPYRAAAAARSGRLLSPAQFGAGSHTLPFSSASPHHYQSWENTLGNWARP